MVNPDRLDFLEMEEDLESKAKRVHQVQRVLEESQVLLDHLDYPDSLEKEDYLEFL
jgi:hypothetical protein